MISETAAAWWLVHDKIYISSDVLFWYILFILWCLSVLWKGNKLGNLWIQPPFSKILHSFYFVLQVELKCEQNGSFFFHLQGVPKKLWFVENGHWGQLGWARIKSRTIFEKFRKFPILLSLKIMTISARLMGYWCFN